MMSLRYNTEKKRGDTASKNIAKSVIIFLFFVLIFSGCSSGKTESGRENDWRNEVLLAQSCGMDGLRCCPDKDPKCQFGQQCCVDPNDPARDYCAEECNFGSEGSFCRTDKNNQCDLGLVCQAGDCVSCGGENEPCCIGDALCENELVCHKNQCLQCGLPGNPCCSEGPACLGEEAGDARLECRSAVCAYCGSGGGIACENGPNCDEWHLLNNGSCLSCGGYNQPCCQVDENNICKTEELECRVGFCAKK